MLKERRQAAEKIAGALFEAEDAIDLALAKAAAFTGAIPTFRKQCGASALVGQDAMERASQAVMALAQARAAIVEAHKDLDVAKGYVGLGAVKMVDAGQNGKPTDGVAMSAPSLATVRAA